MYAHNLREGPAHLRQEFRSAKCRPAAGLQALATAGNYGEYISNIERDVLRRAGPCGATWFA